MNDLDYLKAVNILYLKYEKSIGERGFASFSERMAWLTIEYMEGSTSSVAGWWKKDLD